MARLIALTDDRKRDAQINIEAPPPKRAWSYQAPTGLPVANQRFIKLTERTHYDALLQQHDGDTEALAQSLIHADPEIDLEVVGRSLGEVDRVWLQPNGEVLYSARFLQVVFGPDGEERSRSDFVDVEATVDDESPLPWTGRLLPVDAVVKRFALVRQLQLRHVNGLTFDFLYDIAKVLDESGKMLFVGSGAKGAKPLIFQTNGSPYRGFLEGRVRGDAFRLVLHLSNLELKPVA